MPQASVAARRLPAWRGLGVARPPRRTAPLTRAPPPPRASDASASPSTPDLASTLLARQLRSLDDAVTRQLQSLDDDSLISTPSTSSSFTERSLPGGAGRAWHAEERSEGATPGGGYARSHRSQTVVVWGVEAGRPARPALPAAAPPSLLSPAIVVAALLAGAYVSVARAFARTFEDATTYKAASKWLLVLLWPVLALVSPAFRRQLSGALAADREQRRGAAVVAEVAQEQQQQQQPPPLPLPSQTAGGRTTADSSLLRPDRWSEEPPQQQQEG